MNVAVVRFCVAALRASDYRVSSPGVGGRRRVKNLT
jgi:hypothetical protein